MNSTRARAHTCRSRAAAPSASAAFLAWASSSMALVLSESVAHAWNVIVSRSIVRSSSCVRSSSSARSACVSSAASDACFIIAVRSANSSARPVSRSRCWSAPPRSARPRARSCCSSSTAS
eukprot:3327342-Prymnesium_polylepis.1